MLKLSVCLQVNGKTVFWKCWKLSLKNFILRSSKSGGCQDDFSGLVSSFKLPHNDKDKKRASRYPSLERFHLCFSSNIVKSGKGCLNLVGC